MRRSTILDTVVGLLFHSVIVLSIYFLFAGHNQPGGGFVGGLIAGSGIGLRYTADGMRSVREILPLRPWTVLSSGLFVAAGVTLVPMLFGRAPLESSMWVWNLPLLGEIHPGSAVVFDIGVYLVVVGLLLMIFEALGDEGLDAAQREREAEDVPGGRLR